jgi:hypothetical protein
MFASQGYPLKHMQYNKFHYFQKRITKQEQAMVPGLTNVLTNTYLGKQLYIQFISLNFTQFIPIKKLKE